MSVFYFGRRIGWILCFVSVTVLFSGLSVHALLGGKITKYTADQVMIDPQGKVRHSGKVYVTPGKMRIDGISPRGEGSIIMIFRRDKILDMPIRTKSQDGSMTELRNIKEGSPANKYFEVPKEYKKVSNMMELMGMDMPGKSLSPGRR